jgi:hypothetical protein
MRRNLTPPLTAHLVPHVNYRKHADGSEQPVVRWNSTEIYSRIDGQWRIIHRHSSYVKPDLKQPISEGPE